MTISAIFAMGGGYDSYDTSKFRHYRRSNYDGYDKHGGFYYEDHNNDYYYYNGYNSFYSSTGCCHY